jgi:hypothetical protein
LEQVKTDKPEKVKKEKKQNKEIIPFFSLY